jgi:hypothetical protein
MDRTRPCLYLLQSLYSEKLLASDGSKFPEDPQDRVLCETCGIRRWSRRSLAEQFKVGPINPAVAHNKREEPVIWSFLTQSCLVHSSIASEMESQGFTGYELWPISVRFRDGFLSHDYRRLVVTGWAGMADPMSGIELVESCAGCDVRRFSPLKHPRHLVDVSKWKGEDFFVVWPLANKIVVTQRLVDLFQAAKVRTCEIRPLVEEPNERERFDWRDGYLVAGLVTAFPTELADRYRCPPEIV